MRKEVCAKMTEAIKEAVNSLEILISPRGVQAIITVLVTITLLWLVANGNDVPEDLLYAWFVLLGLYMELPKKVS